MALTLELSLSRSLRLIILVNLFFLQQTQGSINRHAIVKRDSIPGDDEMTRTVLEIRAKTFPDDRFDSDPILVQSVDAVNEHSTYKDLNADTIIYEREKADKASKAIALSASEDKLPQFSSEIKRTYIILRASNLEGTPKKYYPVLAYLTNPSPNGVSDDSDSVTVLGKTYNVEWSVWHDGVLNGIRYSFQYPACRYSVIVPCKSSQLSNFSMPISNNTEDKPNSSVAKAIDSDSSGGDSSFKSSPNEYLDFFRDLDENKISGRMQLLGAAFDIANGAVDAIGSLWCSLSGLILGQCHQYDPQNGYTKSQIGTAVVRSDGMILAGGAGQGLMSDGILGTVINAVLPGNVNVPTELVNKAMAEKAYALGKRRKRSDDGKISPGWRTQFESKIEAGIISNKEKDVIFYGLGNCPSVPQQPGAYDQVTNADQAINFFTIFLRQDCERRSTLFMLALNSEGHLEFSGRNIFIPQSNPLLAQVKLNWIEEQKLSAAFEVHVLSKTYSLFKDKPDTVVTASTLLDRKTSRSVRFLEAFSIVFINEARTFGRRHNVRLLRHLVQILRSTLEKLGEETRNLESCTGECASDKGIVFNDKFALMGVIKFIMHRSPINENIIPALKDFIQANQPAIEAALKESKL